MPADFADFVFTITEISFENINSPAFGFADPADDTLLSGTNLRNPRTRIQIYTSIETLFDNSKDEICEICGRPSPQTGTFAVPFKPLFYTATLAKPFSSAISCMPGTFTPSTLNTVTSVIPIQPTTVFR